MDCREWEKYRGAHVILSWICFYRKCLKCQVMKIFKHLTCNTGKHNKVILILCIRPQQTGYRDQISKIHLIFGFNTCSFW